MVDLVHLTPERNAKRIVRSGISARSRGSAGESGVHARGVYLMPTMPSFTLTHQWVRELRRWHPGPLVAVHVRLPDDTHVAAGRYGTQPERLPLAAAAALVRDLRDPRGHQIFVPRAVTASEVRRVRRRASAGGISLEPTAGGRAPAASRKAGRAR